MSLCKSKVCVLICLFILPTDFILLFCLYVHTDTNVSSTLSHYLQMTTSICYVVTILESEICVNCFFVVLVSDTANSPTACDSPYRGHLFCSNESRRSPECNILIHVIKRVQTLGMRWFIKP
jgi:hypothetical protein